MEPTPIYKIVYHGDYQYAPPEEDYVDCPDCIINGRDPIEYYVWDAEIDEEIQISADQYNHPEKYPDEPWAKHEHIFNMERCQRCDGSGQISFQEWKDEFEDPDGYED